MLKSIALKFANLHTNIPKENFVNEVMHMYYKYLDKWRTSNGKSIKPVSALTVPRRG